MLCIIIRPYLMSHEECDDDSSAGTYAVERVPLFFVLTIVVNLSLQYQWRIDTNRLLLLVGKLGCVEQLLIRGSPLFCSW